MAAVTAPASLAEVLRALRRAPRGAHLLAGGTDLMVEFENGRSHPGDVIDLWQVAELRGIQLIDGELHLGALTTCTELLSDARVASHADLLATAAREFGAVQIRNRATIGGNLGTASPAADLTPALMALGARARLRSLDGERELAVEELITGYRTTARAPDELIHSVIIPPRPPGESRAFRKVGTRRAQSISKVVVALALVAEDGVVSEVRAAAGSVAPRTVRLSALHDELAGQRLNDAAMDRAIAATLTRDVAPVDDVRSSAAYRRQALGRVLRSLLSRRS